MMLSAHIPAVASNLGDAIVRRGMYDDAVHVTVGFAWWPFSMK